MNRTAALELRRAGEARRDLSVFINCPFDGEYGPSMDAIIFTIVCCGYEPRSAIDKHTTADSRMERIVDALRTSRQSIHDLSRIYGEGQANTARMNMPLELGIAMAMRLAYKNGETKRTHDWTAVVPEGAPRERAVSDLNGFDLEGYDDQDPFSLVTSVMRWLVTRQGAPPVGFTPRDVVGALPAFRDALAQGRTGWAKSQIPWAELIEVARAVAEEHKVRPDKKP